MWRRLLSTLLCLSLILACIPSAAATDTTASKANIEITCASESDDYDYLVTQYEGTQIAQTVAVYLEADSLLVTNYKNGEVTSQETIRISDRVTKTTSYVEVAPVVPTNDTRSIGSRIGSITYATSIYDTTSRFVSVYSKYNYTDTESHTINALATDTLAVVSGIILGIIGVFVAEALSAGTATQIAIAVITSAGGSAAGGAIGVALSEEVAVQASYYTLTGYEPSTGRYTRSYNGVARQVITQGSNSYREWFYENFTPRNWKDRDFAYWLWCDLSNNSFPGVSSYGA